MSSRFWPTHWHARLRICAFKTDLIKMMWRNFTHDTEMSSHLCWNLLLANAHEKIRLMNNISHYISLHLTLLGTSPYWFSGFPVGGICDCSLLGGSPSQEVVRISPPFISHLVGHLEGELTQPDHLKTYKSLTSHGMILQVGGTSMSKAADVNQPPLRPGFGTPGGGSGTPSGHPRGAGEKTQVARWKKAMTGSWVVSMVQFGEHIFQIEVETTN